MTRLFLIFIILFICATCYTQSNFKPGYIIQNSGDTIQGMIDFRDDKLMGRICTFKSEEGALNSYSPYDIKGFRFNDSRYYVSRNVDGEMLFLEFIVNGLANLYSFSDNKGEYFYIETTKRELMKIEYSEETTYVDDKEFMHNSKAHYRILTYQLQDAPGMQSEINSIKVPHRYELTKLVKKYHNSICAEDDICIVYQEKAAMLVQIEALAGGVLWVDMNDESWSDPEYSMFTHNQYFLYANIYPPRTARNMSIRTGFAYFTLFDDPMFMVPLMMQYTYPKGIFRPKLAGGFTFGFLSLGEVINLPHFMIGTNVTINKTISLSINYDRIYNSWTPPIDLALQIMYFGFILTL
jgi:hypothetical protein